MLIPISNNQERLDVNNAITVDSDLTFRDIGLREAHIEEFIKANIGELFADEETLKIVGQQTSDQEKKRSDLIAIDDEGSIVLIEIKRDMEDIIKRGDMELQAIRYASALANIESPQELVEKIFAPYIERYAKDDKGNLTSTEKATREIKEFLTTNKAYQNFNRKQRIILIASEFDKDTLAATAWLMSNDLDISCFTFTPVRIGEYEFIEFSKILPPQDISSFYPELKAGQGTLGQYISDKVSRKQRRDFPRMKKLFEWGIIKEGDSVNIKNKEKLTATVIDEKYVEYQGEKMKYNEWGQAVTGWSSIGIYEWTVLNGGKTLHELRMEKMEEIDSQRQQNQNVL